MNFGDDERLELNELCGALVDGTLDAAQRKRLAEMLANSEEARRFYVRAMSLSASLHEYASEMQTEPAEVPANERPRDRSLGARRARCGGRLGAGVLAWRSGERGTRGGGDRFGERWR